MKRSNKVDKDVSNKLKEAISIIYNGTSDKKVVYEQIKSITKQFESIDKVEATSTSDSYYKANGYYLRGRCSAMNELGQSMSIGQSVYRKENKGEKIMITVLFPNSSRDEIIGILELNSVIHG